MTQMHALPDSRDTLARSSVHLVSGAGFGSLAEAKRAGWLVRIRNIGPSDWIHYGAYITHPTHGSDFLSDRKDSWMRADASRAAFARINEMTPNIADEGRSHE